MDEMNANNNYDAQIEELQKTINTLKGKITTLEDNRKTAVKKADDLLASSIFEKKKEIEKTYSEVLSEAEKRLKAAESDKAAERKKNIDELVEKNTRSTKENNVFLNNEIKRVLKDNGVPGFVNSHIYFSLWAPYTIGQFFTGLLIIIILIMIAAAGCISIYKAIFKTSIIEGLKANQLTTIMLIILISFIFLFVYGVIWLLVEKVTKKKPEVLKQVKELRKNIKDNEKEIEKIAKKTSRETTDDQFDYTKLDREIEAGKLEVENYKAKKEEAYNNFVNTTQVEMTNKMKAELKKETDAIDAEIETTKAELAKVQKEHDELKLKACDDKVNKQ